MEYPVLTLFGIVWVVFFIATHVSLTIIVYRDAKTLTNSALGISPFLWAGVAFSFPAVGIFIYWLMNHSTLSKIIFQRINTYKKNNPFEM